MAESTGTHAWQGSDAYEAYMGRWSRPVAEAALAWLALPHGLSWLDVGCGTGALTGAILETAAPSQILGVDPSAEFVATAKQRITDPRAGFALGDAHHLPAGDDTFDVVIAGLVLHFVPEPQQALREMARAAGPSGTVAAYVWDFAGERQFTRYLWQAATALDPAAAAHDPARQCAICQPGPLAELFEGAGLREVAVDAVVAPVVFRDFDDYWQPHLLRGSSPAQRYVASLEEGERAVLRERLRAMLPIAADGAIPLLGHLCAVRGTK